MKNGQMLLKHLSWIGKIVKIYVAKKITFCNYVAKKITFLVGLVSP